MTLGLSLSGGGSRAIAFHAGVFRWLAEQDKLKDVGYVSTVSGGSLFMGLYYHFSGCKWPDTSEAAKTVLLEIRSVLIHTSLESAGKRNLFFKPWNWRYILSRADVLAKTIETLWEIDKTMEAIPSKPIWALNGTTGEDGRRFSIKGVRVGDYELGYAEASELKLAEAMAMSASFPGLIGPLTFKAEGYEWKKKKEFNSGEYVENYVFPFKKLHLYDGGVYDNLGIEPLFDTGRQQIKKKEDIVLDRIIVSDAGKPLQRGDIPISINPWRFKRLVDIVSEQTRALRVRSFVHFLQNNPSKGAYYQLGSSPVEKIKTYGDQNKPEIQALLNDHWLSQDDTQKAKEYPTDLKNLTEDNYDLLERHGYETAKWNDCLWAQVGKPYGKP